MEANEQNVNEAPEFEKQIEETRTENESADFTFEQELGLPTQENNTSPPARNTVPEEQVAPPQATQQDFSKNEVAPDKTNDEVRYQYWQSQAAQMKNQLDTVKEYMPMVDYLRNNPEAVQNITPGAKPPAQSAPPSEQQQEEFPPPPEKPQQPAGFSREEAFSDPRSESAQYLDSVDKWRDDMQMYNQLASQYEIATMRESYNKKISGLEKIELQRKQAQRQQQEMANVRSFVKNKYDLGENLDDFIATMNDPKSINMDDLVGYYNYKRGQGSVQSAPAMAQPSQTFAQTQRAQSVPRPMGVQPASNPATANTGSKSFMDALITDDNKHNIL
ncbi:MAG: hypothetical protein Unbinned5179contig1000_39 [Prokaryotic dsDNA virus sp.]|nr:MAG: hypothetical protein Unbinned5179contig1000_39 [Prokaryotic dsDNA virus sp.]|tara:strand:- start:6046 stop:7041 length:996 start_codon:yes stop_codon:yes gene_type:complete